MIPQYVQVLKGKTYTWQKITLYTVHCTILLNGFFFSTSVTDIHVVTNLIRALFVSKNSCSYVTNYIVWGKPYYMYCCHVKSAQYILVLRIDSHYGTDRSIQPPSTYLGYVILVRIAIQKNLLTPLHCL